MKTKWYNAGLILLAIAISFSPRFGLGNVGDANSKLIEIRIEDILLVGLCLFWFCRLLISKKNTFERPPLLLPILAWLGFGLLGMLVNIILGNIEITRAFFFFLKEIEFFLLYFYVFCHVRDLKSVKLLLKVWLMLSLINVSWIIFLLATGLHLNHFYYGPMLFAEPQNPFGSGVFFLTLFLFFFNILLYYYSNLKASPLKKGLIAIIVLLLPIGVFASGSQTAFYSLVAALPASFILFMIKSKIKKPLLLTFLILGIAATLFSFIISNSYSVGRQLSLDKTSGELTLSKQGSRINIWWYYLEKPFEHPLGPFIGLGKSFVGEAHDQYIRNFVETGIIGSVLFFLLIFTIIKTCLREFSASHDHFIVAISSAAIIITLSMLIASIPAESFIYAAKISELYWFFIALAFAAFSQSKKEAKLQEKETIHHE